MYIDRETTHHLARFESALSLHREHAGGVRIIQAARSSQEPIRAFEVRTDRNFFLSNRRQARGLKASRVGDMTLFCRVCDPTLCSMPTSVRCTASEISDSASRRVAAASGHHNPRGRKLQGRQGSWRTGAVHIRSRGHGWRRRRGGGGDVYSNVFRSMLATTGRRSPRPQGGGDALGTTMIKIAGKIFVVGRCRQCYRFLLVRPLGPPFSAARRRCSLGLSRRKACAVYGHTAWRSGRPSWELDWDDRPPWNWACD